MRGVDDFIYLFIISYSYSYYSFVRRTLLFHQKRGGTTERFQTEFKANKQRTTTNKQRNRQQQQQQQTTNKEEDEFERVKSWASRGTKCRTRLRKPCQTAKGGCID